VANTKVKIPSAMRRPAAAIVIVLAFSLSSFAWGPEGHRIVADVAGDHLNLAAKQRIRDLLGDGDLASISTWADEIKNERRETYLWHFVDIPWNAPGFSDPRDCNRPSETRSLEGEDRHNCVVDEILKLERTLADQNASRLERTEALKFLVHLVADIHQPMHAIGKAHGGNDIHISEFGRTECGGRPCNLHLLWDIGLIKHAHRSELDYVARIEKFIFQNHLQTRADGSPEAWANESFEIAHQVWLNDDGSADERYYRQNILVLDKQLALAGLRLAKLLNRALGE
jgi:S1/P1 Nuclease